MLNSYERSYEDLLERLEKPSVNLRRARKLCVEIQKAIIDLNPESIKTCSKFIKLIEHRDTNTS